MNSSNTKRRVYFSFSTGSDIVEKRIFGHKHLFICVRILLMVLSFMCIDIKLFNRKTPTKSVCLTWNKCINRIRNAVGDAALIIILVKYKINDRQTYRQTYKNSNICPPFCGQREHSNIYNTICMVPCHDGFGITHRLNLPVKVP